MNTLRVMKTLLLVLMIVFVAWLKASSSNPG